MLKYYCEIERNNVFSFRSLSYKLEPTQILLANTHPVCAMKGKRWRGWGKEGNEATGRLDFLNPVCLQLVVTATPELLSTQSRTQSPQALWSAVGCQERHSRIRKNLNCLVGFPVTACIVLLQKSSGIKFYYPIVSPSDQPLAKEPEDSGYEISVYFEGPLSTLGCSMTLIFFRGGALKTAGLMTATRGLPPGS